MKPKRTGEDSAIDSIVLLFMIVFSVSVLFPFWSMLVDSFSTPAFAVKSGLKLFPPEISLKAYQDVFGNNNVAVAYLNTTIRTVSGTFLTLLVCMAAAYGISKDTLPFRKTITSVMIFTMFFGGGLIPTYLWFKNLGLINNRLALIIPHVASAYYIVIMRNFFREIPPDLEESAVIDGATIPMILLRIILPLSGPIIATIGLWSVVFHWNAWFDAMIYNTAQHLLVLQLLLRRILLENDTSAWQEYMQEEMISRTNSLETVKAATMFVSIGPIILAYPFIQKYFVKGIMVGSLKG